METENKRKRRVNLAITVTLTVKHYTAICTISVVQNHIYIMILFINKTDISKECKTSLLQCI